MAYTEDTKGDEIYTVYVIDAQTGAYVDKPLLGVTAYLQWADDGNLVYITMDETLRPHKVLLLSSITKFIIHHMFCQSASPQIPFPFPIRIGNGCM